ncbi:glycosyltransferase family 9 protein [Aliarcobacter cryaerophilus]|uniref:glycosyltransferase family 9 protein n=1 Tax=Aliarcobacter cryaerophilus TaxID=28198 RepID=UPI0021B2D0C7|nr:glycosyltransferase family 9 protein [Aliarcobacter cryaerophilus]MCT7500215.1 hypothetical protein [Aliarcobacter cryaerophilus]MCT7544574.1 hypothetical protein [Aliarcobacter cryaerophilus]
MLNLENKDRLLIIRSAEIGDFLVVLPFINYLKNIIGIPDENVDFIIINNNKINPIKLIFGEEHTFTKNSSILSTSNLLSDLSNLREKYKNKEFNKVIYLPFLNESISSKLKKIISIKYIVGMNKKIYGLNLKDNRSFIGSQYTCYFDALKINNNSLDFNIEDIIKLNEKEEKNIDYLNVKNHKINVALYINSKLKMKIWREYNYYKIVEYIYKNYQNIQVYLIGGVEDFEYNKDFLNKYNLNEIENIAGKLSIRETIFLFNKFNIFIGNDGSPIHMAAFSKCAILGIYTYKEELASWDPIKSSKFITIRKNVVCKHCYLADCIARDCIDNINWKETIKYIEILFKENKIRESVVIL